MKLNLRKMLSIAILTIPLFINLSFLFAEVSSGLEVGSVKYFNSADKKFAIEIKILDSDVDKSPSECKFKEGEKIVWQRQIPGTPGEVAISNNGKFIAMSNYGLYDEGWYKSLSIYDDKGELVKEFEFSQMFPYYIIEISDFGECVIKEDVGNGKYKYYNYKVGQ